MPIWVVRVGDNLYVRSFRGSNGVWWRTAQASRAGHIRAGGVEADVTFTEVTDNGTNDLIDTAYRAKYGSFGDTYVKPMIAARSTTLHLTPR